MAEAYRRVARLMLGDGQIWYLFDFADMFKLGDFITDQAWKLIEGGSVMAGQIRTDPGPDNTTASRSLTESRRPQMVRFNPAQILWILADQE